MQTLNAAPRDAYTSAQVLALLRDTPSLVTDKGLEVIDLATLAVVEDVSDGLWGGEVRRNSYATLHGTASFTLTRELDWGRAIVRPYAVLADGYGSISTRWNLGAYIMDIPDVGIAEAPTSYAIEAFDIISILDTPVGEVYSVAAGSTYLQAAVDILVALGFALANLVVDQTNAALTVAVERVWAIDENITFLSIINDLLGAIGYQGLWSDWDGRLHLARYVRPIDRAPEFVYDSSLPEQAMTNDDLRRVDRYLDAPNSWTFVRTNSTADDAQPVEGNGIYTYVNQSNGKTSVDARGRPIRKVVRVEAADQDSLISRAEQTIAADRVTSPKLIGTSSPNPAHWHFDRITVYEPRLGPPMDCLSTQWTYNLKGGDMSHEWTIL